MTVASLFGLIDLAGEIIGRGARFRTLTRVVRRLEVIEEALAVGVDVRHMGEVSMRIFLRVRQKNVFTCY
jgi:hypothetical protein